MEYINKIAERDEKIEELIQEQVDLDEFIRFNEDKYDMSSEHEQLMKLINQEKELKSKGHTINIIESIGNLMDTVNMPEEIFKSDSEGSVIFAKYCSDINLLIKEKNMESIEKISGIDEMFDFIDIPLQMDWDEKTESFPAPEGEPAYDYENPDDYQRFKKHSLDTINSWLTGIKKEISEYVDRNREQIKVDRADVASSVRLEDRTR